MKLNELNAIRARLTSATPGPWFAQPNDLVGGWCVRGVDAPPSEGAGDVADFIREDDAHFIAAAPSDLAALIAEVERLRARAEKAEANYAFMVERAANQHLDGYRELAARAAAAENEADRLRARLREVAQILIEHTGASGPMDAEDAARKAVERMNNLRTLADEKAAEAGLYARRMEQAQRSRSAKLPDGEGSDEG